MRFMLMFILQAQIYYFYIKNNLAQTKQYSASLFLNEKVIDC